MISLKTFMTRNIARTLVIAVCFLPNVLPLPRKKMVAFGGSGPYDHTRITRLALERFAERTGLRGSRRLQSDAHTRICHQ